MPDTVLFDIDSLNIKELLIDHWQIRQGDSWCVIGHNGSGKHYLFQLLMGDLPASPSQAVARPSQEVQIRGISFEQQQHLYERELALANNDLLAEEDTATLAKDFLPALQLDDPLIDTLNLRHRLDTAYTLLSTGESRKLLVAQAVLEGATCLVLDNPFDSLDVQSCKNLTNALETISKQEGLSLVFLISNRADIPAWCDQLASISSGRLALHGAVHSPAAQAAVESLFNAVPQPEWPDTACRLSDYPRRLLIDIPGATVRYGDNTVLDRRRLQVKPLQHTLITGSNGSGKSTLLGLVTGDNPQCYANSVEVLGFKRGSGESIWELKQNMGIVSSDIHRRYRVRCNVNTVVCSGFFDSIGLYEPVSEHQIRIAKQWLAAAGLDEFGDRPFQGLSYGEQQLTLIARALVKSPLLLILDEPTQGLDEINRQRVMNLMETLHSRRHTTILFVSHRLDERLPLFEQHIDLDNT